jgi:hypothetical protein
MTSFCNYLNCKNKALYGPNRNTSIRCREHREGMRLVSQICLCGKAKPSYNISDETKPICCSKCKTNDMIDVINKRCKCGKARPHYNTSDQTKPICCSKCKTDNMINIVDKKCKCGKAIARYNTSDQTKPICCSKCKTDNMINIVDKKCKCGKYPSYGEPGHKPICCLSCKTDTMVDVLHKRCRCGKTQPIYNEPGKTKPICCSRCKTDTMVDVKNKKCLGVVWNGVLQPCPYEHTGNKKYNNFCTECFRRNFPLDPLTFQIRSKTKEIAVRDFINSHFEGFEHDRPLSTGNCDCNHRRRIDHRKFIENTLLVIETDENQHKSYDQMDEEIRYNDLHMVHGGKWIYIRFNPDKYINKKGIRKNPSIATRLSKLKDEIEYQMYRIQNDMNNELLERVYLYYDNYL